MPRLLTKSTESPIAAVSIGDSFASEKEKEERERNERQNTP